MDLIKNIGRLNFSQLRMITLSVSFFLLFSILPSSELWQSVEYEKAIDDLKVGIILPLSGANRSIGQEILSGLESALSPLAMEKAKDRGDYFSLHNKIKIEVRDNQGNLDLGKTLADELYTNTRVSFLIGGLSLIESLSYAEISSRRGKMFISLLPKSLEGFLSTHTRAFSFSSSYHWQLRLLAQFLGYYSPGILDHLLLIVEDPIHSSESSTMETTQQFFHDFSLASEPSGTIHLDTKKLKALVWGHAISYADIAQALPPKSHNNLPIPQQESKILDQMIDKIFRKKTEVVVIHLGLTRSMLLLQKLKSRNFQGDIYGLDYWDHPSFRPVQLGLKTHYVVQYDQDFFDEDFKEVYYFHTQSAPTLLAALGYDVMFFILSLYQRAKSIRIPPFLRLIEGQQIITAPASLAGVYRRSQDHSLERKMILRSFNPRTKQMIGSLQTQLNTEPK